MNLLTRQAGLIRLAFLLTILICPAFNPARADETIEDGAANAEPETEDTANPLTAAASEADTSAQELQRQQSEITAQQKLLDDLDAKIKHLTSQQNASASQAEIARQQLELLNQQIQLAQRKLLQLQSSAKVLNHDLDTTILAIKDVDEQIRQSRVHLAASIRSIYDHDRLSLLKIIASDHTLSEILAEQQAYRLMQSKLFGQIQDLRQQQDKLNQHQANLTRQQHALQQLQKIQQVEQTNLHTKEQEQKEFLQLKESEQAKFQNQITEATQARQEIEQRIFRLRGLGIELKLTDVLTAAKFAGSATQVRPALLLGVLKVETNLGENLGSGIFPDDMHPDSREAFLRLTQQLKRDPYHTPISRRPRNIQGWGGAMGPAQVMPATWEGIASRVAALLGKPQADPYELADALIAIGIMLGDRGATDRAKEVEAVARYMAGPNWQYHLWYANRVLAVAAEYEKEGL